MQNDALRLDTIEGRNPVTEALKAGRVPDKVFIAKEKDGSLRYIAALAREAGAAVVEVDRAKLDRMSRTRNHQGVIASIASRDYADLEVILESCKGKNALLVICDGVTDPSNFGAIIRTAEAAGAAAVIARERRAAGLTPVVAKTSAGALEYIPVARVANITQLLERLKKEGFWIFGTAGEGSSSLYDADFSGSCAVVLGSEGEGISRLVLDNCDYAISIPMYGRVGSLNVSAAAAVVLFEAAKQRAK